MKVWEKEKSQVTLITHLMSWRPIYLGWAPAAAALVRFDPVALSLRVIPSHFPLFPVTIDLRQKPQKIFQKKKKLNLFTYINNSPLLHYNGVICRGGYVRLALAPFLEDEDTFHRLRQHIWREERKKNPAVKSVFTGWSVSVLSLLLLL